MSELRASANNKMNNKDKTSGLQGEIKLAGGRIGVLLVHSLGGSPIELRFLAHGLARQGYTVLCPLIPGLTGGTDVLGLSRWQDWFAAVEAAHDELSAQCDTVIVGGLSAGSMLALRLAQTRPDRVSGLMLLAPTMWPNGWAIPKALHLFKLVRQTWFARLFRFRQRAPYGIKDERIRNFVIESFRGDGRNVDDVFGRGGGMVLQFRRLVAEVKRSLGTVRQHTIVFHPRHDDQSDLSNAMTLMRRLGGLVEGGILDDCYHMGTLDQQRHIVMERSIDFVGRLTARDVEQPLAKVVKSSAVAD